MLGPDFDERMTPWRELTAPRVGEAARERAQQQVLELTAGQDPLREPGGNPVLLVGDVHGNAHHMVALIERAADAGISLLIQLGDTFGTHPDTAQGAMELVSAACTRHEVDFVWLHGNHDRHPDVPLWPVQQSSGLQPVRPRVWHLPRGHTWTWHGVRWTAIGGAVSVDAAMRTFGTNVWFEEEISDSEADKIITDVLARHGGTDVLLTHDRPAWVEQALGLTPGGWWQHAPGFWAEDDFHRSQAHQQRLDRIVTALRPRLHLHGHLHRRYTLVSDDTPYRQRCRVEGLAHEGLGNANTLVLPCSPDLDALLSEPFVRGDAR
ncbi:MAG: metallophosphoesterase [Mycobacteriales bacterium]